MEIINADHAHKVDIVKDLIRHHGNKFLTVVFTKKDGTERTMQCHRSKVLERSVTGSNPEATAKRKATLSASGLLAVEEICKDHTHQFRTVNANTVKKITCEGNTWIF